MSWVPPPGSQSTGGWGQGLEIQLKPVIDKVIAGCGKAGAKRVTVANFTDLQGQVTELGRYIAEELATGIVEAEPQFGVIDRANLRTILAEHKLNMSGLVNSDTAKRLGQIAGVDGIVTGTITPLGDSVRLAVKVIATETATVMAAARADVARTKAIEDLLGRDIPSPEAGADRGATAGPTGSTAVGRAPSTASAATTGVQTGVFQNKYVRFTVRSVQLVNGSRIRTSLAVDNLTQDDIDLTCRLKASDASGAVWAQSPFQFQGRTARYSPGVPGFATLELSEGSRGEGAKYTQLGAPPLIVDLSGECEISIGSQIGRFPTAIPNLAVTVAPSRAR